MSSEQPEKRKGSMRYIAESLAKKVGDLWIFAAALAVILIVAVALNSGGLLGQKSQIDSSMGGSNETASPGMAQQDKGESQEASSPGASSDLQSVKVVKNAYMSIKTEDVEETLAKAVFYARSKNGYVENSQYFKNTSEAHASLRIPSGELDSALAYFEKLGRLEEKSLSEADVSRQYRDLAARIDNLKAEEQQLRILFEKATQISDMLEIERELFRIRQEIELNTSYLQSYDRDVAYSMVSLRIYSEKDRMWDYLVEKFKSAFEGSLYLLILILAYVPYVALAYIVYVIIKKIRRRKQ